MSRLDQPVGGFGGPRVVKPQANVYTVLLLAALLFVLAALAWEVLWILPGLKNPPMPPGAPGQSSVVVHTQAQADRSTQFGRPG